MQKTRDTLPHPDPAEIRAARLNSGLTQTEAAALTYNALRTWQQWEGEKRAMPWGLWELFLLKTNQHPDAIIVARSDG